MPPPPPLPRSSIKAGETYTVQDLLYAMLLSSANDAARALAEKVSGCEEAFAKQLTQEVRQWGAYRTTLATANGLPADNQYTTAQDLCLMFRRAMGIPELAKIMETKYYTFPGDKELRNHNRFLFTTPLAVAGKTGFTHASKHTYVGMFQNGDKAIIVAMMGSIKNWADLRPLIEKGFELEGAPIAELPPAEEKTLFRPRTSKPPGPRIVDGLRRMRPGQEKGRQQEKSPSGRKSNLEDRRHGPQGFIQQSQEPAYPPSFRGLHHQERRGPLRNRGFRSQFLLPAPALVQPGLHGGNPRPGRRLGPASPVGRPPGPGIPNPSLRRIPP